MPRLILGLPFFCFPILAQNVTGSITGAVVDKSGSQIPAVNVKLTSETFLNNRNGVAPTPRRVRTPGGNIGGPVYIPGRFNRDRNKVFFFTSLEFIREADPHLDHAHRARAGLQPVLQHQTASLWS